RLIELRMKQNGPCGVLSASRCAVNADARNVQAWIFRGGGFHPEDAVWETGVLEVVPADVVKRLRAVGCAHAVDFHHDKAKLGQRLVARTRAEGLWDVRALWPGVDVFDNRIFPAWVEIARAMDDSPDVRLAIASPGDKHLGRIPAAGLQFCDIRRF